MMKKNRIAIAWTAFTSAVFVSGALPSFAAGKPPTEVATAALRDAAGKPVGKATFTPTDDGGVAIDVEVSGLAPGAHGIHIHEKGQCQGPDFKSAGGHYLAAGKHHGLDNPQGPHGGDLPSLDVKSPDTPAHARFVTPRVSLAAAADAKAGKISLFPPGGTSLVIHSKADDQKSDPAGNSGDRVVCGVIEKKSGA